MWNVSDGRGSLAAHLYKACLNCVNQSLASMPSLHIPQPSFTLPSTLSQPSFTPPPHYLNHHSQAHLHTTSTITHSSSTITHSSSLTLHTTSTITHTTILNTSILPRPSLTFHITSTITHNPRYLNLHSHYLNHRSQYLSHHCTLPHS